MEADGGASMGADDIVLWTATIRTPHARLWIDSLVTDFELARLLLWFVESIPFPATPSDATGALCGSTSLRRRRLPH
jgi:hypothetical protein